MSKPIKSLVILNEFIRNRPLTRFDAEKLNDHVLPSTVSELEKKFGIKIYREWVEVPCRTGMVRCCRYSLPTQPERERAAQLLAAELVAKGRFKSEVDALASFGIIR